MPEPSFALSNQPPPQAEQGEPTPDVQRLQPFLDAVQVLGPFQTVLPFFALVRGALASGLLAAARTPCSPAQMARALHLAEERVVALCQALDAYGVFVKVGELYGLEEHWALLFNPAALFSLENYLDYAAVQMQVIEHATSDAGFYWQLATPDRLALATGVTFNPFSPESLLLIHQLSQAMSAELHARLSSGGHYLELGCGVAGHLLSMVQAYPTLSAVGVELAADLLGEAERRAALVGVADRVRFFHGDARTFHEPGAFDVVYWSQAFFPAASRAAVLQVARHALKPDGFLIAPPLSDPPAEREAWYSEAGQDYAVERLMYASWGVPARSAATLHAEIEAAGFTNVQLCLAPLGRRFILAQRP